MEIVTLSISQSNLSNIAQPTVDVEFYQIESFPVFLNNQTIGIPREWQVKC